MLWVSPISESEAASIRYISRRSFREQRDAGQTGIFTNVEHLAQPGTVPVLSGNYGKVSSSAESDLILQSSPGLGRSIAEEEGERRNIQPRRVSGFAIFNFAPDPAAGVAAANAAAATTVGPETTVQDPVNSSKHILSI